MNTQHPAVSFIISNIIVALVYFVSGYLGNLLSIPPMNASPVWPAAGAALAMAMVCSHRILPGLFVGAMAIKILVFWDFSSPDSLTPSLITSVVSSIGTCAQAAVGAYLIHRLLKTDNPLIQDRKIFQFFILAMLSCVIGPTVGVAAVFLQGFITVEDLLISWSTWWIGDAIGVFVFTPLVLTFIGKPKSSWHERKKLLAIPLSITLVLVLSVFQYYKNQEEKRIHAIFDRQVNTLHHYIDKEIKHRIRLIEILKALFDSPVSISAKDFEAITLPIVNTHRSMRAMAWISYISDRERLEYERKFGIDFQITERDKDHRLIPSAQRKEYFPISYIEPLAENRRALGFDISTNDPVDFKALKKAQTTGLITITEPFQLIQDLEEVTGVVMYAPIYQNKSAEIIDSQDLKGLVAVVFRMSDEMKEAFSQLSDIQLWVKIKDQQKILYSNIPDKISTELNLWDLNQQLPINVADRQWLLTYRPSEDFIHAQVTWNNWWSLLIGFIIAGCTGFALMLLSGRTLRTEDLVRRRTQALAQSERHFRELVQAQTAIFWRADPVTAQFTFVSDEAERVLGYPVSEWLEENFWIKHMHRDDKEWAPEFCQAQSAEHRSHQFEYRMICSKGKVIWLRDVVNVVMENGKVKELIGAMIDITEQKRTESEIYQLAFYDSLTGLANRRLLLSQLNSELSRARRKGLFGAIIFLDLDRFKILNDSMGHHIGDELLIQVAGRINQGIREDDLAARLGGDEFVILIRAFADNLQQTTEGVSIIAEKIRKSMEQPYFISDYEHHCSTSIGITLFPEQGLSGEKLFQQADKAMYRSKEQGRNTISFFHPSLQKAADARLFLEKEMRLALKNEDFILYYQPQVEVGGGVRSCEALIRWRHSEKGLISPADFIPVAEESGLIIPLGLWVFNEACQQMRQWLDQGVKIDHIAVNVSSRQFRQGDFVDQLIQVIESHQISAQHIFIELTEGVVIDDFIDTIEKMRELKAIGVQFSIDDFGTGYSSLAYLKQLPLDELKIDQSFIRDLIIDENDTVIVETIINMTKNLNLDVIAEGVETVQQKAFLEQKGCVVFQGYLFSKPLPALEFIEYLQEQKVRRDNR